MREIPLTCGYVALVDDADYERVIAAGPWHACINKRTGMVYARHNEYIKGSKPHKFTTRIMHRFILGITDARQDVDHRNRTGWDNRRCNLRVATRSQNRGNSNKPKVRTSSKWKGVSWHKKTQKWSAYFTINGKRKHLGLFTDELSAARAYDVATREHFGDFAKCNLGRKKG